MSVPMLYLKFLHKGRVELAFTGSAEEEEGAEGEKEADWEIMQQQAHKWKREL